MKNQPTPASRFVPAIGLILALAPSSLAIAQGTTTRLSEPSSLPNSRYGTAVAISSDSRGPIAFVSEPAPPSEVGAAGQGRIYEYWYRPSTGWVLRNDPWGNPLILSDDPAYGPNQNFGAALALGDEGESTALCTGNQGGSVDIGSALVIGAPSLAGHGAFYVRNWEYNRYNGMLTNLYGPIIRNQSTGNYGSGDQFGAALAIDGNTILVGGPGADEPFGPSGPINNIGSATIFEMVPNLGFCVGVGFNQIVDLATLPLSPPIGVNSSFGQSVAIDLNRAAVVGGQRIYLFDKTSGSWAQSAQQILAMPANFVPRTVRISGTRMMAMLVDFNQVGCSNEGTIFESTFNGTSWSPLAATSRAGATFDLDGSLSASHASNPLCGTEPCRQVAISLQSTPGGTVAAAPPTHNTFRGGTISVDGGTSQRIMVGNLSDTGCCNTIFNCPPFYAAAYIMEPGSNSLISIDPLTTCTPGGANWVATTAHVGTHTFQWYRVGGNGQPVHTVGPTTAATATFPVTSATPGGTYYTVLSTVPGVSVRSANAALTHGAAPSVSTTMPGSMPLCPSATFALTTTVNGVPHPTITWFRGGTLNANGTVTGGTLITNPATAQAIAGPYYYSATNSCGTVGGLATTITAPAAPSGQLAASSTTPCPATPITLTWTPAPGSTTPTRFDWFLDSQSTPFASTTSGSTNVTPPAGTHTYSCIITDSCGVPLTSPRPSITVTPFATPQAPSTSPADTTGCLGGTATFDAGPITGGKAPFTYRWYLNSTGGTLLATTTAPTWSRTLQAGDDTRDFVCEVTDSCGQRLTLPRIAHVSFTPLPQVTGTTPPANTPEGSTLQISANATNHSHFRWLLNGVPLTDGTQASGSYLINTSDASATAHGQDLIIVGVAPADAGTYTLEAWNNCPSPSNPTRVSWSAGITVLGRCPTLGTTPTVNSYLLVGAPNGIDWAWKITSTHTQFQPIFDLNVQGVPSGSSYTIFNVAQRFVDSINGYASQNSCANALVARVGNSVPLVSASNRAFSVEINSANPAPFKLQVAPAGTAVSHPTAWCDVAATTTLGTSSCSFNPGIELIELPGTDCNGNGQDDLLDLYFNTSIDANGDFVPDECAEPCTIRFTRLPSAVTAATASQAVFSAAASSSSPITYQWFYNGSPLNNGPTPSGSIISGAHLSTLAIDSISSADLGYYSISITNACGSLESGEMLLTVRCTADFNQDGGVDGSDISAFFDAWEQGDPSADTNNDGGIDGADVDTFFTLWENADC